MKKYKCISSIWAMKVNYSKCGGSPLINQLKLFSVCSTRMIYEKFYDYIYVHTFMNTKARIKGLKASLYGPSFFDEVWLSQKNMLVCGEVSLSNICDKGERDK